MKHLVNIIAWRRPDFLAATLERLRMADRPDVLYRICIDHDPHPDVTPLACGFQSGLGSRRVSINHRPPCLNQGPTRNIVAALHESLALVGDDEETLIHWVEDDIFVSLDYYLFHESAHRLVPRAFSVTACNPNGFPAAHHTLYPKVAWWPGSPCVGVSFRPEMVRIITSMLPVDYMDDPVDHIRRTFPDHGCPPDQWSGIDGALGRVMASIDRRPIYPFVGRAYHAGFVGAPCENEACNNDTTKDGINNGPHRHGTAVPGGTIHARRDYLLSLDADGLNSHATTIGDHVWYDPDIHYGPALELTT